MKKSIYIGILISIALSVSGCENKSSSDYTNDIVIDNAFVVDFDDKTKEMYKGYNEEFLKNFDVDFRVITTALNEDINVFANKTFIENQKKSRSQSGKALLLVINTKQDKVRLEVSMALEPVYTDAFVSYVERKGMIPYLRDNKIGEGVYMMTELSYDRAVEAKARKEFMPPMESKSIGAGAKVKAHIGIADPDAKKGGQVLAHKADDPMRVMQKYLSAIKNHNKNPKLDIYTDTTKRLFC